MLDDFGLGILLDHDDLRVTLRIHEKAKRSTGGDWPVDLYHGMMSKRRRNAAQARWMDGGANGTPPRWLLGTKAFGSLEEHAHAFLGFFDRRNPLFPKSIQEGHIRNSIFGYFAFMRSRMATEMETIIKQDGSIGHSRIKAIVADVIKKHHERWSQAPNITSIRKSYNKKIRTKYAVLIRKAIKETFEQFPVTNVQRRLLRGIAGNLFSRFPEGLGRETISGVVIAGFGEKDILPRLASYHMDGIAENRLKYEPYISEAITSEGTAAIIPFAQTEMVATFMEGMGRSSRAFLEGYLSVVFDQYSEMVVEALQKYTQQEKDNLEKKLKSASSVLVKDLKQKLRDYTQESHVQPVIRVVSGLPKDELAAMAESLVNLVSFKRKVTMEEEETVGGPIDVAVISKGDGFIWIKRKQYFKPELNPQFFSNYYKESKSGTKK